MTTAQRPSPESFIAADLLVDAKGTGEGTLRGAGHHRRGAGALVDAMVKADGVTVANGAKLRGSLDFG